MDVATITMPRTTARKAYLEYHQAVRGSSSPVFKADEALMRSYHELAKGNRILNLYDVMRVAGVDYQNRPNLAVARADLTFACFDWLNRESGYVPVFDQRSRGWYKKSRTRIVFPSNTFPWPGWGNFPSLEAMVPTIPPRFRPKTQLHNYHLLWEAKWTGPPTDPILLKQIHGLLFVVVAQWDLTELEQSVLGLVRSADD